MNNQKKLGLFLIISCAIITTLLFIYFVFEKKPDQPQDTEKEIELSILDKPQKNNIEGGKLSTLLVNSKNLEATPTISVITPTPINVVTPTLAIVTVQTVVPTITPTPALTPTAVPTAIPTVQPTSIATPTPALPISTGAILGFGTTAEEMMMWDQIWELRRIAPVETESFKLEYNSKTRLFNVLVKPNSSTDMFTNWLVDNDLNLIAVKYFAYIQP
ncbi:MAG: hypothetical protein AUK08_03490 [Candidatus Pacebacteria bacterium CG2_30_36_39]|nr:hypothetical protein [Candidatus Pacearchaeota archaeon]OIP73610.1 MAG: hypothetical protein AUK08_03490 [Candidatus Pacebacteria bacterium CG2_30_36_39]